MNKSETLKQTYENIAKEYGGFYKRTIYWAPVKVFLEKSSGTVLDVGCANAPSIELNNKSYYGFDISYELLKLAQKKFTKLVNGDMTHLPFQNNSFDNIICIAALHHLGESDQIQAIKELNRVLKIGGKIMLAVWYRFQKRFLPGALWSKHTYVPYGDYKRYYFLFSKADLKKLLIGSGFEIKELQMHEKNIFLTCEKINDI